jgi:hypothetical protein
MLLLQEVSQELVAPHALGEHVSQSFDQLGCGDDKGL